MEAIKPEILRGAAPVEAAAADPGSAPAAESPEVTALVLRAKEGNADAFSDLMRLHERRIISLGMQMGLRRDDALDACQDTFVKVFKYIGRFESGRPFFKWLYRIAINVVYDHLRRVRGSPTVSLEELDAGTAARSLAGEEPSLQSRVEAVQMAARVRQSLDCLSRRERMVFVLRDLQELSTEEIGVILGLSQITVRRHCMSARQKIRQRLLPRRP
jgi:RNA polymerase sigma-70 factor (ECF subfamily)